MEIAARTMRSTARENADHVQSLARRVTLTTSSFQAVLEINDPGLLALSAQPVFEKHVHALPGEEVLYFQAKRVKRCQTTRIRGLELWLVFVVVLFHFFRGDQHGGAESCIDEAQNCQLPEQPSFQIGFIDPARGQSPLIRCFVRISLLQIGEQSLRFDDRPEWIIARFELLPDQHLIDQKVSRFLSRRRSERQACFVEKSRDFQVFGDVAVLDDSVSDDDCDTIDDYRSPNRCSEKKDAEKSLWLHLRRSARSRKRIENGSGVVGLPRSSWEVG